MVHVEESSVLLCTRLLTAELGLENPWCNPSYVWDYCFYIPIVAIHGIIQLIKKAVFT